MLTFADITQTLLPLMRSVQAQRDAQAPDSAAWAKYDAHTRGVSLAYTVLGDQIPMQRAGEPDGVARWSAPEITHTLQELLIECGMARDAYPVGSVYRVEREQRQLGVAFAYGRLLPAAMQTAA